MAIARTASPSLRGAHQGLANGTVFRTRTMLADATSGEAPVQSRSSFPLQG
jgi:hypothetical protein